MTTPTGRSPARDDGFWVPLLTHYRRDGDRLAVDSERMAAHVRSLRPYLRQFMIAGSTGDGWEIDDRMFDDLLALTARADVFDSGCRLLVGVLRPTTAEVIARARTAERALGSGRHAASFDGLAVCPPVDAKADQATIARHFDAVIEATHSPVAVYQLPQVTGCTLAAETLRDLVRSHDRITMFKDSSGADAIAQAGLDLGRVMLVRGAEGGYAEALRGDGPYDGWLLSTGNAFAISLRRILDHRAAGDAAAARALSDTVSGAVARLFDAAAPLPFGNAFSNANRAADHVLAHGRGWGDAPPPLTISGNPLPRELLETAAAILGELRDLPETGYLHARA